MAGVPGLGQKGHGIRGERPIPVYFLLHQEWLSKESPATWDGHQGASPKGRCGPRGQPRSGRSTDRVPCDTAVSVPERGTDMSNHIDDPRFPHLRVCREHGGLYDGVAHPETGEQQLCHDRDSQPRWERRDFNEWVHLCEGCLQETRSSGSRYSPFFCPTCLLLVKGTGPWIPIGRHQQLFGSSLPPNCESDSARRTRLTSEAVTALHRWGQSRLAHLVGPGDDDPTVSEVVAAARRSWTKDQAVRELVEYWRPLDQRPT